HARQAVIREPYRVEVREVELPPPAANQVLVATEASAVSPGTELAVYTGTHQWLKDPALPDWKFPFRPGYSAAGTIVAVGTALTRLWESIRSACAARLPWPTALTWLLTRAPARCGTNSPAPWASAASRSSPTPLGFPTPFRPPWPWPATAARWS